MDDIKSLNRLIEVLKQTNAENYITVVKNMNLPISDFENFAHFKEDGYARNCIIKTPKFELILICWKKGDRTPIHGHDKQKCWVYLVDGEMTELRYKYDNGKLSESNRQQMKSRDLTYMQDSMGYHLLKNSEEQKAMTLHLYMNPVESCEVYNDSSNCFENKTLEFYSIAGEKTVHQPQA